MERLSEEFLLSWARGPARKPLVLRGARQIGKTWLVHHLGERLGGDIVSVNFERDPDVSACFTPNDPVDVIALLETRLRKRITPGKTLLFLDEIQAVPQVLSKLRWFAEELPALAVVAAGSLLDFALADPAFSMPVGRISYGHLEPMTFAEFLLASGESRLCDAIAVCTPAQPVAPVIHDRLMSLLRIYSLVGGMPAAVAAWVDSRSFTRVADLHRDLLQTMRDDFARYKRGVNTAQVAKVFSALPRLVGRKFQPSAIDPEEKSLALKSAFRMLTQARVATPVQRTAANGIPLGADVDDRYQKVCLLDTGLFCTLTGVDPVSTSDGRDLTLVNEGQLAEQLVGQELRAVRPFNQEPALFTWVRAAKNSNAEVDYVLQTDQRIVPIEVKAGAPGRLRSLHAMVVEKGLELGVRVSSEPMQLREVETALPVGKSRRFRLLSIPFYLVSQLPRLIASVG
jgi:uncharacterized protein